MGFGFVLMLMINFVTMIESKKRIEFCCKTEMQSRLWGPECSRQDIVFVGHRYGPRPYSLGLLVEMVLTVLTNGGFLVPIYMLARRGKISEFLCGFCLFLSSTLYHLCDTFQIRILGMTAGNWHRLDNVFSIANCMTLLPLLMGGDKKHAEIIRWGGFLIGVFFQELHPWHLGTMLAPILLSYCYYFLWTLFVATPECGLLRLARCRKPFSLLFFGLIAFFLGLYEEDTADSLFFLWARAAHGLWHLLNAMAAASFISILLDGDQEHESDNEERRTREEGNYKPPSVKVKVKDPTSLRNRSSKNKNEA